jgi:phenylalanyl-tRNA synthetase beta chain
MKFSLAWLKAHLDVAADANAIADKLTMLGLEVESLDDPAQKLDGFIVGHVLEAGPHPNADRLKLCQVSTGAATLQVVCGAPNARAGLKVALALPGTVIPATGAALKVGLVRGIESKAMMCSAAELLLGEDHGGIIELAADAPVGAPLAEALHLDPVYEVAITPNRADCLGVRGVARDLAAAGLGTLKPLTVTPVPNSFANAIPVRLDFPAGEEKACPLFLGRTIRGVKNGESPAWLKERLVAAGQKPISALVDITNYFTLDLGRPLHVFDTAHLKGGLTVRFATDGESLAALNGKRYQLADGMTVIADDSGVVSLGGVMGGESTGVGETTSELFIEVALFDPVRTARTGRLLAIDSDARYCFERGVDPGFAATALDLASRMIVDLCGGEASEPVIAGAFSPPAAPIAFRPDRVQRLGGIVVDDAKMRCILEALGCVVNENVASWSVVPPSWRGDITGEHDLVEEILRINGYDAILELSLPRPSVVRPVLTPAQRRNGWVRRALAARGLAEAVTYSFLSAAASATFGGGNPELLLANPISSDLDALRPSLMPNLLGAVARNADRGQKDIALFEIGPQFDSPERQTLVAAGVRGGRMVARHWATQARPVDAFDAKADALAAVAAAGGPADGLQVGADAPSWYHPGRSGALKLGTKVVAWFGELHPRALAALGAKGPVVGFELFLDALPLPKVRQGRARPPFQPSPFQPIERDFAFLVDRSVPSDAVLRAARGADKALIADVLLFDVYVGTNLAENQKSLAIQVVLQPRERTLTDAEIEAASARIVDAVVKATGGSLRA